MLYTITHGKHRTSTAESYQQYLDIVNKETLLSVAETLDISGVAKSHAKDKMTNVISAYVLEHPEEILSRLSVKELQVLKDCVAVGANTCVERPSRRFYDTLTTLLLVSVYHSKKERRFYFLLPDELRELFAPLLDKAIKEAKKREKAEKTAKPKKPVIKVEEPEYLDDDEELFDDDFENEWDDEDGYTEEIIGVGHRHYDSLGDFLTHLNHHDSFDSVLAVQDFWHNANVIESKNAVITLYASVVYVIRLTGKILYRSTEPIEVRIDTEDLNSITIPDLPSGWINEFSTDKEVMNYSYGVLTIEGEDNEHTPFVVSLI